MTIPVDGVAPILLTILLISNSENHGTLLPYLRKIQVISYSCDGTKLEWKIQQEILNEARNCLEYTIKNP